MGKSTISMAIFHCYVSWPEGILCQAGVSSEPSHFSWFSSLYQPRITLNNIIYKIHKGSYRPTRTSVNTAWKASSKGEGGSAEYPSDGTNCNWPYFDHIFYHPINGLKFEVPNRPGIFLSPNRPGPKHDCHRSCLIGLGFVSTNRSWDNHILGMNWTEIAATTGGKPSVFAAATPLP